MRRWSGSQRACFDKKNPTTSTMTNEGRGGCVHGRDLSNVFEHRTRRCVGDGGSYRCVQPAVRPILCAHGRLGRSPSVISEFSVSLQNVSLERIEELIGDLPALRRFPTMEAPPTLDDSISTLQTHIGRRQTDMSAIQTMDECIAPAPEVHPPRDPDVELDERVVE